MNCSGQPFGSLRFWKSWDSSRIEQNGWQLGQKLQLINLFTVYISYVIKCLYSFIYLIVTMCLVNNLQKWNGLRSLWYGLVSTIKKCFTTMGPLHVVKVFLRIIAGLVITLGFLKLLFEMILLELIKDQFGGSCVNIQSDTAVM